MKLSVILRLILHTLSFGPQLYLASSRKYSLVNLKHWNTRNMVMLTQLFNLQQYLMYVQMLYYIHRKQLHFQQVSKTVTAKRWVM